MKGRRILVTGGTGFIGRFAMEALANAGAELLCFGRRPPETNREEILFFQGDLTDPGALVPIVRDKEVDTIVHLAGFGTTRVQSNPQPGVMVNVMGTSNVLEAARMAKLRVIFTSSIAVYGKVGPRRASGVGEDDEVNPVTVYGAGKLLCEKIGQAYAQNYGVMFVALRLTAVYGFTNLAGREVEHPTFSDHAKRVIELPLSGKPVLVETGGRQPCDFVYVKDVAQAIAKACTAEHLEHRVFNIGSGELRTLKDFEQIVRHYKTDVDVTIGEEPNLAYPFMGPVDISLAIDELGYKPTPFLECIHDYIAITQNKGALS